MNLPQPTPRGPRNLAGALAPALLAFRMFAPSVHAQADARVDREQASAHDDLGRGVEVLDGLVDRSDGTRRALDQVRLELACEAPAGILDWVRQNLAYPPYAGVLRGQEDTIVSGAGSAWDRVLGAAGDRYDRQPAVQATPDGMTAERFRAVDVEAVLDETPFSVPGINGALPEGGRNLCMLEVYLNNVILGVPRGMVVGKAFGVEGSRLLTGMGATSTSSNLGSAMAICEIIDPTNLDDL